MKNKITPTTVWSKDGNLTLKAIKVVKWMSEETTCFTATVVYNGEPAGEVSNEGQGGATFAHFKTPELRERIEAWAATIDPKAIGFNFTDPDFVGYKVTAADICDYILEEHLKAEDTRKTVASIRRRAAKQVWSLKGDEAKGEYRSAAKALKMGYSVEQVIAELKAKGRTLVNDLTDEQIAAHFIS
jgi:hypothetical protein